MRREDWVRRLNDVLHDVRTGETKFDYGTFNCGLFAARCADAIRVEGGAEEELRTHFTDEASARAWVEASGGIEALMQARLGTSVPWWLAGRGDHCLVETPEGPGVGVCTGETIAVLSNLGLSFLKLDKAIRAWKVV